MFQRIHQIVLPIKYYYYYHIMKEEKEKNRTHRLEINAHNGKRIGGRTTWLRSMLALWRTLTIGNKKDE